MLDRVLHHAGAVFLPETVHAMSVAYDRVSKELGLAGSDDPLAETLAQTVIEIARTGVHDADRLANLALARVRL